jgi:uncharacterized membrane protein YebE (DUF533 family)
MIDFTTIQANPIPPPIVELQKANANLTTENKAFKTAIYIGVGALAAYFIYKMYKKHKEDETSKKNQSPRD